MHKLYVAMDESEYSCRGLRLGAQLAPQLGAKLSVVSVVAEHEQVEPRYQALEASMVNQEVSAEIEVLVSHNAKETLAALLKDEESGLCMSAHGRRPVPEMLIGSVTAGVVRRAPRPVYLSGPRYAPERHERVESMMVCVDGSKFAEAMLPHAVALSKRLGARLTLLQVIDASAAAAVPRDVGHIDVMESGYVSGLARKVGRDHAIEVDWEVLHGEPADAIVSYIKHYQNVMLAMTTHGRSGLSQVIAGSVSHEVLHEACCPVAVLRPSDVI